MRPRTKALSIRMPKGMYQRDTGAFFYYGPNPNGDKKPLYKSLGHEIDEARRQWGVITSSLRGPKKPRFSNLGDAKKKGLIYVVQAGEAGPVKVGFSTNEDTLRVRTGDLQTGCPFQLTLLGSVPGTMGDEYRTHLKLHRWRATGEWFHPVPEVLAHVENLLKSP